MACRLDVELLDVELLDVELCAYMLDLLLLVVCCATLHHAVLSFAPNQKLLLLCSLVCWILLQF
jgi:hypothetical protein